jgi:UDP-GlcNAc:undecaprenyl-phosphate GlcNAc-1-phosphate transferase
MDFDLFRIIILPFVTAFFITGVSTPIAIFFLKKFKVIDDPKRKHPAIIHKKPIPRGGGIPLFLGAIIASLIFLPLNALTIAIYISATIALVVGVLDDKFDISPYFRFLTNFICAIIVVAVGISVAFITNPLGGILFLDQINIGPFPLSSLVAIVWIVWVMNMLNWSKGVDGQMPGIVAISAAVIGILSLRVGTLDQASAISANLSFIISGASVGFLLYNFYPAKIFPGYGATSIYLLLAIVSILSSAKLATAILVMGVPLADGAFTIIRRIFTGKSPFWHDRQHFHHLLLSMGYDQRRIALFYWIVSAILGALSFILSSKGKLFAILMLLILVGGALLSLNYLLKNQKGKKIL